MLEQSAAADMIHAVLAHPIALEIIRPMLEIQAVKNWRLAAGESRAPFALLAWVVRIQNHLATPLGTPRCGFLPLDDVVEERLFEPQLFGTSFRHQKD